MGYYKKQSAPKGKVTLEGLPAIYNKLSKVSKFCHRTDNKAKAIHKKHATNLKNRMKRKIKPASKDIYVKSKDRSTPTVVEKGTYKRSIGAWVPKGSRVAHVYYIGPRTGSKVNPRRDAWFQLIVEQDKQFIRGNNRHAGVIEAFLKENLPKMEREIIADYKKHLAKIVSG